ncbi:hypothetical protein L195_g026221 [Trifolium pratense]|uniref:Uncharacterized protein n=1 Tax=Trifolium pratense TaxID=57577 RepID=A0A2K3NIQ5_TRIPR|nr:hypothetical protein L195_g026221 [Trifolium pratense]
MSIQHQIMLLLIVKKIVQQHFQVPTQFQAVLELAEKKPLPEKGKFLKAVVEAGPLLQTLLVAGPLPQWQHPPLQLKSIEIPPVSISVKSPTSVER